MSDTPTTGLHGTLGPFIHLVGMYGNMSVCPSVHAMLDMPLMLDRCRRAESSRARLGRTDEGSGQRPLLGGATYLGLFVNQICINFNCVIHART